MERFKDLILLKLVQSQCALTEDVANFANLLKVTKKGAGGILLLKVCENISSTLNTAHYEIVRKFAM